jgi:superoxide dismutase, Cu-Zn family
MKLTLASMAALRAATPVAAAVLMAAQLADSRAAAAARAGSDHAVAVLQPASGGSVRGTIHFRKRPAGVHVQGTITGLSAGAHGFHVHEYGECSAPDFSSAGDHFNPTGAPHGARTDAKRHVGDLGNVEAAASGTVALDYTDPHLRFEGDRSILGRGVIVHEKADDFKTQPTGNAGGRVACGVIGVAKPE